METILFERDWMVNQAVMVGRETLLAGTEREAFLRLVEQYGPALRRLAAAYLDREPDRQDLFQEIAVALWRALPRFRGDSSERTWLYRIAHNVAISFATRHRGHSRRETPLPPSFAHGSERPDAEHEMLRAEQRRQLTEAIRTLSPPDKQIILLHLEGLSYAEIGEVSGFSEAALATRLTRIREKLRLQVQGEGGSAR